MTTLGVCRTRQTPRGLTLNLTKHFFRFSLVGAQGSGMSVVFRGSCGLNYVLSVKLRGSEFMSRKPYVRAERIFFLNSLGKWVD